jgi:hypothetical protein
MEKTITLEVDETTAGMLALFCKRAIIERVEPFADGEAEAHRMTVALENLRRVLEKQGFSPR